MTGTIKSMPPKKGFCFILSQGIEYFLHRSEFHGFWDDLEMDFNNSDGPIGISFDAADSPKGPRASNAKRIGFPNA